MEYHEFFERFGASVRKKNIRPAKAPPGHRKANRRAFTLPKSSEMPEEFIRLCPWEMEYLFCVARDAKLGILETGRFNGGSLFVMACAAPQSVPIWSIDLAPQNDAFLREQLARFRPNSKISLIVGDSQHAKYPEIGNVDVLFIDGDHTYEGCMADIENWYENLVAGGHLIFHDSYQGKHGVQAALVDFMKKHPELQIVQSPFIGAAYWQYPAGSIAHFIKRA
jgi:predicted O-methyltransferase YrrM